MRAAHMSLLVACCVVILSSAVVIVIRPDSQKDGCMNESSSHLCVTMSQYAANYSDCSRGGNMRLVFLSGSHHVERNMSVANLRSVTLQGVIEGGKVSIECVNDAGFTFHNISNLSIVGLSLSGCKLLLDTAVGGYFGVWAGVFFKNVTNLLLSAVSVQNCSGYGLFPYQTDGELHIGLLEGSTAQHGTLKVGIAAYQQCETSNVRKSLRSNDTASALAICVTLTGATPLPYEATLQHTNCSNRYTFIAMPADSSTNISLVNRISGTAGVGRGILITLSSFPRKGAAAVTWCTQGKNTTFNRGTIHLYLLQDYQASQVTGINILVRSLAVGSVLSSKDAVPADPISVHFCQDGVQVNDSVIQRQAYSGESFNVSMVVQGVKRGRVKLAAPESEAICSSKLISSSNGCSVYSVKVYTQRNSVILRVTAQGSEIGTKQVNLSIPSPPLGFTSTGDKKPSYECIKNPDITANRFSCKFDHQEAFLIRPPPYWLGFMSADGDDESPPQFVLYMHCPIDYCKQQHSTRIRTDNETFYQDDQCDFNHAGTLCGHCQPGLSLSLGSSSCLDCSGTSLLKTVGISVGLAVLGVLLVLSLLTLNLTVTRCTLTGGIFYSTVFYYYWATLLPNFGLHTVSRLKAFFKFFVFASSLQLSCDCCLYNGLGVIGRTWVQFVLVGYLWGLAGAMICISRRNAWISRHIGNNAVPTLATIILYSHTSMDLAIMHALRSAGLEFAGPAGNETVVRSVLLYDGNIPYFHKNHIPLFVAGCIFGAFSLCFTLTLLCVQPLQRFSHLRPFRWVNKLKPLLDAYTCPHLIKPQCQFWNGFLLLIRTVLLIVLSTHLGHNSHVSLDALSIACLVVLTTSLAFGGVYTKRYLNILFSSYILNLGLLAVVARDQLPSTHANSRIMVTSFISLSVATATSLTVISCHVYQKVRSLVARKICRLHSLCTRRRRGVLNGSTASNYQALDSCTGDTSAYNTASTSSSDLVVPRIHPPLSATYREPQLMDLDSA